MSRNRFLLLGYLLLAGALMAVALVQCNPESKDSEKAADQKPKTASTGLRWKNLHDSVQYVGKQACKQCHAGIYNSFKQTGMGQSFGKATKTVSDADFSGHPTVYDSFKNFYYTPYWRDSNLFIKEYRLNDQGDTVHQRVEQVDYIIGSGHHTNSHLYQVNGYLYQAPLTFYTQDQQWDMPPGFGKGANSRYSRMIKTECTTCHNMYPEADELSANRYTSMPEGIGCERCHGPGELHVKEKRMGNIVDTSEKADRTIVNPSKLETSLKNDVCQRCHLQGNAVKKPGKDFFDFKPGMKLSSVLTVFRPQFESEDAFIMASHSERLQQSACFKGSRATKGMEALNCITCHNPHKSVDVTEDQYFNNTCEDCHGGSAATPSVACAASEEKRMTADNNCIQCHMPKSGSVDIPHVSIHDHNIRVVDSMAQATQTSGKPMDSLKVNGLKSYNNENPTTRSLAKAYLFYYEKFRSKLKFLDSAKHYMLQLPKATYQNEWVHYYYLKQDFKQLQRYVANRDSLQLTKPRAFYRAGQAYANTGRHQKAADFYKKAVRAKPYNLNYQNKLASAYIRNQQLKEAERTLNFLLEENPKQPITQNNRGFLYLTRKNFDKAQYHFEKAMRLDPDYGRPALNMAKVYLGQGKHERAKKQLNKVRREFPSLAGKAQQIKQMMEQQSQGTIPPGKF